MRRFFACILAFVAIFAHGETLLSPQTHTLKATPKTVAWGYYDAAAQSVLRIHSGDIVVFDTMITNSPTGLEKAGLPADQVQQELRDIYKGVTNKGSPVDTSLPARFSSKAPNRVTRSKFISRRSSWRFRMPTTRSAQAADFSRTTIRIRG